jgi:hypothetical protein
MSEITCKLETITPEMAAELLTRNNTNRPIKKRSVAFLVKELNEGRWKVNGETVGISPEGDLVNGQHRLSACVEADKDITTLVARNVPKDAFDTIDTGNKRSAGDTLAVLGEINTNLLAATLTLIDRYNTKNVENMVTYSNAEVEQLLEDNPNTRESVQFIDHVKRFVSGSIAAACHYLFSKLDAEAANNFIMDLCNGVGLDAGDPVHLLRERLIQNKLSKAKLPRRYVMALFIKAWNARRDNQSLKYLRYRTSGDKPEPFPVIR